MHRSAIPAEIQERISLVAAPLRGRSPSLSEHPLVSGVRPQFALLFLFYFFTWAAWFQGLPLLPSMHPAGWDVSDRVALAPLAGSFPANLAWSREGLYLLTLPTLAGLYLALQGRPRWLKPLLGFCLAAKLFLWLSDLQLGNYAHGLHVALSCALLLDDERPRFQLWTLAGISWLNALLWFRPEWWSGRLLLNQTGWSASWCALFACWIWLSSALGPLGLLAGGRSLRVSRVCLGLSHAVLWLAFANGARFLSETGEWAEWLWLGWLACMPSGEDLWEDWQPSAWMVALLCWQGLGLVWLPAASLPLSGPRSLRHVSLTLHWPDRTLVVVRPTSGWTDVPSVRLQGSSPDNRLSFWLQRNRRLLGLAGMAGRVSERSGAQVVSR